MIEAESGINMETASTAASGPAAGRKHGTPRSSRGSIPKKMRRIMTPAQRSLWGSARQHPRLRGKIARMQWVGRDLVDLVSHDSRLVIEIEAEPPVADVAMGARDARLGLLGYRVLRFGTSEVLSHLQSVLDMLAHLLDPAPPVKAKRRSGKPRSAKPRRDTGARDDAPRAPHEATV